jgi:hypothetical protein
MYYNANVAECSDCKSMYYILCRYNARFEVCTYVG